MPADGRQKVVEPFAGVAETHAAVVYFFGDRAYKVKKPVDLGFLDFTTAEARAVACRREVELNSRLALDIYLGVAEVLGTDGSPCDYLVVMRRLPIQRRLSTLVEEGAEVGGHLYQLARLLSSFHHRAARSPEIDAAASAETVVSRWEDNGRRMAALPSEVFGPDPREAVALARRYLRGRSRLFEERVAAGRARDGHGDLLADDIFCLDDGPRVLDCLEFDDALRYGDVLNDVAFLAMDLERLGRPDLSEQFLADYLRVSGDRWPSSLAHHYVAYRAQVRALVAGLRAAEGHRPSADAAAHLSALCAAHLEAARVRLVVVGGAPASGKSTVAEGLGDALSAVVLRSDVVRKQQAGIDPSQRAPASFAHGLYDQASTEATYHQLLQEARTCLERGLNVVLDATFSDPRWRRQAAGLAGAAAADLGEVRCVAPWPVMEERLRARAAAGGDPSDATVAVARRLAELEVPWPSATNLDTTGSRASVLSTACKVLGIGGR